MWKLVTALVTALIALGGSLGGIWIGQRLGYDLAGDRLLMEKRIQHYERLLALLQNLPKYPEPRPLGVDDVLALAHALTAWYFGGAGLFMDTHVRDAYFDLQDGMRIVLARAQKVVLATPLSVKVSDAELREILDRPWDRVPERIHALARMGELTAPSGLLADAALEHLRALGSALRTAMCGDLASRRPLTGRWLGGDGA